MVKGWSYSGEKSDLTKFLSYMYDSENDTFSLRTNFNWSKIKRGARMKKGTLRGISVSILVQMDAHAPYSHVCHLTISIQVNAMNDMDLVQKNKMNERKWIWF